MTFSGGTLGRLMTKWTVILLAVLAPLFYTGLALFCYKCHSTTNKNCGPFFKPNGIEIDRNCTSVCALQRQKAIPRIGQVEAVGRECFDPDPVIIRLGMNSSIGCRWWTNQQQNYTAYYCFCDTDLCNGAAIPATTGLLWPPLPVWLRRYPGVAGPIATLANYFTLPTTIAVGLAYCFTRQPWDLAPRPIFTN